MLRVTGYTVQTFASGTELLASPELADIDLIFIDLQMPGPNGLEVAEHLRKERFNLPIILMTASEEYETERHKHSSQVVDACLKKPLDAALALQTIEKYVLRGRRHISQ